MGTSAAGRTNERVDGVDEPVLLAVLIRQWRERASLSQEQLAELAGMSSRSVRRLERGISLRPRRSSLRLLARALELSEAEQLRLSAAAGYGEPPAVPGEEAGGIGEAVAAPSGTTPVTAPRPTPVTPSQLPPSPSHFVGRHDELTALDELLGGCDATESLLVLIVGGPGSGKTALANRWCSAVADDFPGGSLFLDLRGFDPLPPVEPLTGISVLLRGLGVSPDQCPEDLAAASAMLRSRTAGRRTLLLLDNALDAEQVRPLLPAAGSVAIVTSRDQLRGLTARDATARIEVPPLAAPDAVALLDRVAGGGLVRLDPGLLRDLVDKVGRVPLAIRILGERLARRSWRAEELRTELDESLEAFRGGDDPYSDLPTSLSRSLERLDPVTAGLLSRVSRLQPAGGFGSRTAAVVSGVSEAVARQHLDRLVRANLVEQVGRDRYRVPTLVRLHAAVTNEGRTGLSAHAERAAHAVASRPRQG